MKRFKSLDSNKLESLIMYFVKNFSRPIYKTELVKLIYLFEYYHSQAFHTKCSTITFKRDKQGPYTAEIQSAIDLLERNSQIACMKNINPFAGNNTYQYRSGDSSNRFKINLSEEEHVIANYVIRITKDLRLKQIIKLAYDTPPMRKILAEEKKRGFSQIWRCEIDMNESPEIYKTSKERLIEARKRRLSRPEKGTDEEYNKMLLEKYEEYKDLRRRAGLCLK